MGFTYDDFFISFHAWILCLLHTFPLSCERFTVWKMISKGEKFQYKHSRKPKCGTFCVSFTNNWHGRWCNFITDEGGKFSFGACAWVMCWRWAEAQILLNRLTVIESIIAGFRWFCGWIPIKVNSTSSIADHLIRRK